MNADAWKAPNADQIFSAQKMQALGAAAMAVSDYRLAAKMFDELVKLIPSPIHWISLAEALGKMGKYDEGRKAFESALAIDPRFTHAWFNMGVMFDQANMPEESERCYSKALEISDDAITRNNLANSQRALLKLDDAEKNYRRATELGYKGAQMNLSMMLMLRGDYVNGIPLFELREEYGSDEAYGPAREMLKNLREQ